VRGIVIGLGRVATMDALKPIAPAVSPVPFSAGPAVLGGFIGIFLFQPNPVFLTILLQSPCDRGIKPMRQPPIKLAGERPPCARLNPLQVLDTEDLERGKINLLQRLAQQGFDFCMGVSLALGKLLNPPIQRKPHHLTIREDQSVFIVRVHPDHPACFSKRGSFFFKQKVDKQAASIHPQAEGLRQHPTHLKAALNQTGGVNRHHQPGSTRTDQAHCPIEKAAPKRFDLNEVVEQGYPVPTQPRLALFVLTVLRAKGRFGLFSQRLREARGDPKPLNASMDGGQIRKLSAEVLPLPKQVNEILADGVTQVQECLEDKRLAGIEVVQIHPARSDHHLAFPPRRHYSDSCKVIGHK
jgi:hypothetical protein